MGSVSVSRVCGWVCCSPVFHDPTVGCSPCVWVGLSAQTDKNSPYGVFPVCVGGSIFETDVIAVFWCSPRVCRGYVTEQRQAECFPNPPCFSGGKGVNGLHLPQPLID